MKISHKSTKEIICKRCNQKKIHEAKGLCVGCYSALRYYKIKGTPKFKFRKKLKKIERKQKLKKIKHTFTKEDWNRKLIQTKGFCLSCNQKVGIDKLTIDHIHPISKAEEGRVYSIQDVQPLCHKCNTKKSNHIKEKVRFPHLPTKKNPPKTPSKENLSLTNYKN